MENAVALALGLPFYVGLRSGAFFLKKKKSPTSCLVHRIRWAPHPTSTPVSRQTSKVEITDDVVCVFLVGSRERKWAVLALFGAAQERLLGGRIYEGSRPLPNGGSFWVSHF